MPVSADKSQLAAYIPKRLKRRVFAVRSLDRGWSASRVVEEALELALPQIEERLKGRTTRAGSR